MARFRVIDGGKAAAGHAPGVAWPSSAPDAAPPGVAGAADPIAELYARYGASVYGRCRYLLRDPARAEDAMQDVFARALEHWAGFRAEASPLTWLMKIATHHCLNLQRGERAGWRGRFGRQERERLQAGDRPGDASEARELLRKLLDRFDAETQAVAIHYHLDELTLEEVARLVGRSVPTVRKRLAEVARAARAEALE